MKRRGGLALALAATVAAALASTAGAGSSAASQTQAVSCKNTLKIGFTAPFTGDAGFLGNEQLELGEVRRQDARVEVRPQDQAHHG